MQTIKKSTLFAVCVYNRFFYAHMLKGMLPLLGLVQARLLFDNIMSSFQYCSIPQVAWSNRYSVQSRVMYS